MLSMDETIRQLAANAEAMRALLATIPAEQGEWQPDPDTWSLHEVMRHMYNEERIDFRRHLHELFQEPPLPWSLNSDQPHIATADLAQALDGFLRERAQSLEWLRGLPAPDWETTSQTPWGAIRAGDVLVSWIEHDFLHMRQLIEVLYAWNARQAAPYSVEYAGAW